MNSNKLHCLTSLRAIAAAMIVLQHTVGYEALSRIPVIGRFPWDHGVSFFFVLSGFILTYVYKDLKPQRWREFFVARIARVWPAHLFALLVGFGLGQIVMGSKGILFLNMMMLQSWLPYSNSYFSYNGLSWSISTEMGFYLAFPVLVMALRQTWHWKLAIVTSLCIGLISISILADLPGFSNSTNTITYHGLVYVNPLARLMEFFVGMLAGQWFLNRYQGSTRSWKWSILEIFVPVIAFANSIWGIPLMMTPWPAANEYLSHSGSQLSIGAVIFVYAHQNGFVSRFLSKPIFVFFGEISFSVYLLHVILFWYIYRKFPEMSPAARHLMFWPTLLAMASFSYLFVEQPFRSMLRKVLSRSPAQRASQILQVSGPEPASTSR